MKILIKGYSDDYVYRERLFIDGEWRASVGGGEPEDAIIGRDLISATEISRYMKEAFDAAKRGETLEIEIRECKTSEEFWED